MLLVGTRSNKETEAVVFKGVIVLAPLGKDAQKVVLLLHLEAIAEEHVKVYYGQEVQLPSEEKAQNGLHFKKGN